MAGIILDYDRKTACEISLNFQTQILRFPNVERFETTDPARQSLTTP